MPMVVGQRLGPYEAQSLIGAGGMGEVYRARDTRLNRTVALKILPPELAADQDRRARFEREAHAIAALSDPHICTLQDIGIESGTTYLVMEHLVGETLAERLTRGRSRSTAQHAGGPAVFRDGAREGRGHHRLLRPASARHEGASRVVHSRL